MKMWGHRHSRSVRSRGPEGAPTCWEEVGSSQELRGPCHWGSLLQEPALLGAGRSGGGVEVGRGSASLFYHRLSCHCCVSFTYFSAFCDPKDT